MSPIPTFTDLTGCTWRVQFTREMIATVKGTNGIDLARAVKTRSGFDRAFPSNMDGAQRVVEVLFIVCGDQVAEESLSPEAFARILAPPTFEKAVEALMAAISRFYPKSPFARAVRATSKE